MFYEPVWEYEGFTLVARPDTDNYYIYWKPKHERRYKRKSTRTSDLDEAKRVLVEFAKPRLKTRTKPEDEIDLLEVLVDHCEPIIQRSKWHCAERTALRHWMSFMDEFEVRTIADLTLDMQNEYISWRFEMLRSQGCKNGGSPSTLARELGIMRTAIRNAWKRNILASPRYVRSMPQSPPRPRFIFADEAKRLIRAAEPVPHIWLYIVIALHTLQRPGAILGLRTDQVKLDEGLIDFLPANHVQSNKRKPVVPISETLRPIITRAVNNSKSGHVIEYRGRPVKWIRHSFTTSCKRAGLDNVSPYTLRHTGATLLLASGVPIREVSGMLGHTEQQTTELYGKHHPEFLKKAKDGVDRLFGVRRPATLALPSPAPPLPLLPMTSLFRGSSP